MNKAPPKGFTSCLLLYAAKTARVRTVPEFPRQSLAFVQRLAIARTAGSVIEERLVLVRRFRVSGVVFLRGSEEQLLRLPRP